MGGRPSAKYLNAFDKVLSSLSEKSNKLRYRSVAMQ